ncbi:helicase C-terminal domain-containing protein [Anaerosoma tenue]|uniref:helicase C-terminal domain-containing protein n=1 Tax=Anaerosoma tenue TaxID=2933588 RepID=UPI002260EAD3|nr:helicase C-terminal domain-containing protein [Anaerosoma tenue]MCK8115159.1 exonuclease domain-containing protein [Anaerosoma tenue]
MATEPLIPFLQPGTDPDIAAAYATLAERSRTAVFGFEDEVAFVDVETTGFDPASHEVIEVAAVLARGPEILDRWSSLVRPRGAVPLETTQLTGIDDAMLADAPCMAEAGAHLARFVGDRAVVAHNAPFDRAFLEHASSGGCRLAGPWIDSLEVVRIALPRLRSHRLSDLARAFSLDAGRGHRAPDDAETLFGVWRIALTALGDMPSEVVHEVARLASAVPGWGAAPLFSHLAAGSSAPAFDLRRLRTARLRIERAEPLADAAEVTLERPSAADVLAEFAPGGSVERMYETYESRNEQTSMAEAVLDAFASGGSAAIEAGTGVGKSVAYLVPAARFALTNGIAVGVATKTNTLMDQLMHRELPRLAEALDCGLRYTALKGYEHYICLRKLQRLLDAPPDQETAAALAMLVSWVAQTTWGDKEGVNLHWPPRLRHEAIASFADCTKKRCRYYPNQCYLHGARRRATSAHIVVTNHALLFRDLMADGGILPPIRHWIVDEAHAAEAEARDQLSLGAGHLELRGLLAGLHAKGRGGLLDAVRAKVVLAGSDDQASALMAIDEMREVSVEASTIADSFFDFVKDLGAERASTYETAEIRLNAALRQSGAWGTAAGVGRSLARRLERIVELGRSLVTSLESEGEEFAEQRADLAGRISGVAAQKEGLLAVLDGTDDSYVYAATVDRRRDASSERLDALLLDVGSALAEQFYPRIYSVVYTSATIAAGADFSHFERAVGLDRLAHETVRTLRLDSSYDFERQMAVFVPTGLPDPCGQSDPGYQRYIAALATALYDIHVAMGGSVLTLFTNRRDMQELHRRVALPLSREGLRVLIQERNISRKRVAEEFIADERVSLFATKSFWEGFDAKGDTLRCVIVPRLPFGAVNDPVLEERKERDPAWWEHYYLPEAVLELKQAAGRLIRSASDRGCLVLADARLTGSKPYARRFLDALPVRDIERLPVDDLGRVIRDRFGDDRG